MRLLGLICALTVFAVCTYGAFAQEAADTAKLPEVCQSGPMAAAGSTDASAGKMAMNMPMSAANDAAHQAMMSGMDKMQSQMMSGMQASNIDVAFVCGMIPHHQGAISMARAELKYGKDPHNRQLAEEIIAAQEREITAMLTWLKSHGH